MKKSLSLKNLFIFSSLIFSLSIFTGVSLAEDFDGGELIGFPGDPAMPTQAEINKIREETGYNDYVEGDQIINKKVECFDYYTFQSVQVLLGTDKDSYLPGETIKVLGEILNENNYPVIDGNVFVRVTRKNDNYQEEGSFVIDEFFALENVAIDKNNKIIASFEWKVPESTMGGEYIFDYFFSVGKRFNLGGLPFTNEVVIGQTLFTVVNKENTSISFDKSGTKVNGVTYKHIGDWPRFGLGEEVVVTQPLTNTFGEDKKVDLTYELYYWDSLNEKDLIDTKSDEVIILSGGSIDLEYSIPEMNDSVYYLKITAKSDDQKSIINVRIISDQEHPRLSYPAVTKFPLKKGDDFTLFTCFHNTSGANTAGKVVITLTDRFTREVGKSEHDGLISPLMGVTKVDIKAEKDYEYLKLKAEIYHKDGTLIDSYETIYDCRLLNDCEEGINIIYILIGALIVIGIAVLVKKKWGDDEELSTNN